MIIKNGHVLDPGTGTDGIFDVLIRDGKIVNIGNVTDADEEVIDASGLYVLPGFVDMHVHFRDPGFEYKETVGTGSKAAARGGYTTVCTMPNTKPVMDCPSHLKLQLEKIKSEAVVNVLPVGAVTMGQEGKELSDISGMKKLGICAISEDGKSVMDSGLYEKAMKIARLEGLPVLAHCEDKNLVAKGALNAGAVAARIGVPGITNSVEDIIAVRDVMLAKDTGAQLHLCHCSTEDSVRIVKEGKEAGVRLSAEVCPHHFTLTEDDIPGDDANYKMNPPLRKRRDVEALKKGLKDGIIEVISTDHAPHSAEEKAKGIAQAPFGIVGLETAFALSVTELLRGGVLTKGELVKCMSTNPARILGIEAGTLKEGAPADIVVVSFDESYIIDSKEFASKGKNTPFDGRKVYGKVKKTICGGRVVYSEGE